MKKVQVAIIGAGTSGLTARREVARTTDDYLVIDDGPLGTTCARVGCMPSKVLIQAANDFARRTKLAEQGISGQGALSVDTRKTMQHVRELRDRFVRSVLSPMKGWEDKFIAGRAKFIDPHILEVNGDTIHANKIILAVGSRPILPKAWEPFKSHLLTTDQFFELEELPKSMAIIGLGVIGLELGQALSRLGIETVGITVGKALGGLTDPVLQDYVSEKLSHELPLHFNGAELLEITSDNQLKIKADDKTYSVDAAILSVGRQSNLDRVNIAALGLELDQRALPSVDPNTLKVQGMPHIFIPGDSNGDRPILHEAADEGIIAGHNAVSEEQCFKRRTSLGITFSDPNIATVGKRFEELQKAGIDFVTGTVSFEGQGRSIVKLKEQGLLHIYAAQSDGRILGAELQAPDGEHLAHLLAWAISLNLTVREALRLPFYHPVVEEGVRTALRNCAKQLEDLSEKELFRCEDPPIR